MGRSRRSDDRGAHPADDRAVLAGVLRALVALAVVASVVVAATAYAPQLVSFVEEEPLPPPSSDPPPAGEGSPSPTDPDDPGETTYETDVEVIEAAAVEAFVHAEVNDRRAERGLDPIEWDGTIASVSRAHSADMYERDFFAHTTPDGDDPYDRFRDVAGYCRVYGENIAKSWVDAPVERPGGGGTVEHRTAEGLAEGLVDQWMNSSPHRAAILERDVDGWDRGGVGVYVGEDGAVLATHNFCTEW